MDAQSSHGQIHRLTFDIRWPPGHVACYLVDGPEPILVDATAPGKTEAFENALAEHGYRPSDIEHLLLTHPHIDHIGEVPTVLEAGAPTVYAPVGVRSRFAHSADALERRVRKNSIEAGLSGELLETAVEMAVGSLERNVERLPPESIDVWMTPEDPVSVGHLDIESVHLPGHQADHLSYLAEIDGDQALFAGDMGIESFRPIIMHDGLDDGYREAFDAFYTALDRMASLDADRIYPGHGPIHDELQGVIERDRSSLDNRLDGVVGLVEDGHATALAVARALSGEHEIQYLFPEAIGALAHLEETGRIASELRDGVRRYRV